MSQRNTRLKKRRSGRRKAASRGGCASTADHLQSEHTLQRGAQSTDASTAEDVIHIPGFYYDSARKKYFRILPGQNSNIASAVTAEIVREKAAEEKRQLHLTHLCTPNSKHLSHVHSTPTRKTIWQHSHNITDMIFNTRQGHCLQQGQQRITESFIQGLHPCGSRKVLEVRTDYPVGYGQQQHMSYMKANKDQDRLLCVWSLKDDNAQRIQLLHVKSFTRSHRKRAHKIEINVHQGDTVIVQQSYQITGLTWTPQFSNDNEHGDYILYTTSPFIGNAQSLAIFRRLDCSDPRIFHCEDFKLGTKSTWCCAWNRHARQFGIGSQGKTIVGDVESRRMWELCGDKSDVLCLVFSQQGSSVLYSGTRRGHVCTHDSRTRLDRCEGLLTHPSCVSCLHLMTDENYLFASDYTGEIRLWDVRQRAVVQSYGGNYNEYKCLPFHVDQHETILYTAGQDCYSRLWSLKTSKLLCTLPPPLPASRSRIPTLCYFSTMGRVTTGGCPGLLVSMLDELHYYSM